MMKPSKLRGPAMPGVDFDTVSIKLCFSIVRHDKENEYIE